MKRFTTLRLLAVLAGAVLLGCSDASAPVAAGRGPDAVEARHAELTRQLAAQRASLVLERAQRQAEYDSAMAEWGRYEQAGRPQPIIGSLLGGLGELLDVNLLSCKPTPYAANAAIIGPEGGRLAAGGHELVIPPGALSREELIFMEAPTTRAVDVRFQPHGLRFAERATLTMSYEGCTRLPLLDLFMVYLGSDDRLLEVIVSTDLRRERKVEAGIDHFSKYAVAW